MFLACAHSARGARTRFEPRGAPRDRARGVRDVPRSHRRVVIVAPGRGSPPDRARESARHTRPILALWRRWKIPDRDAPRARRAGSRCPIADHARVSRRGARHDHARTLARAPRPPLVGDPVRNARPTRPLGVCSSAAARLTAVAERGDAREKNPPRVVLGAADDGSLGFSRRALTPGLEPARLSRAPFTSSTSSTDPHLSPPLVRLPGAYQRAPQGGVPVQRMRRLGLRFDAGWPRDCASDGV